MSALFPPWTNTAARLVAACVIGAPVLGLALLLLWVRSPFVTRENVLVEQPVPFDHRHHVGDDGIDCRFCHTSVEESPSAGMPSTALCMSCHAQVWNQSPKLDPVREAYFSGRPLVWNRVHDLPDFVYFDHSIHVNKGVGCVTCHGDVAAMPAVSQQMPLTMSWCVDCHRDPTPHLRPREQLFDTTIASLPPEPERRARGEALAQAYDVQPRTNCTTCHR